jgi:serine protease AprX
LKEVLKINKKKFKRDAQRQNRTHPPEKGSIAMKRNMFFQNICFWVLLQVIWVSAVSSAETNQDPLLPTHQLWMNKVDPWIMERALGSDKIEMILLLNEQADLSGAATLKTKKEKGAYVYSALSRIAEKTQKEILTDLNGKGIPNRSFWVANMVWVKADPIRLQELAMRSDIARIAGNPQVKFQPPPIEPQSQNTPSAMDTVEWNIAKVRAPEVWAAGVTGQGAVVAGQDTGYQWDHPALKTQYRGWNGSTASHDFNWHDAIHQEGSDCGANSPFPCDDHGHGTHTMGTAAGDDGAGNQVGMAPGAKWIGCRNMNEGVGTPATYSECFQWFIAPTRINGTDPDPAMAPDVINNSWSCTMSEGCTEYNVLEFVVESVRAAGILTVNSAGNSGSSCGSIREPTGIYDASFTVGNTDSSDGIYISSGRGPVTIDGSNRIKPDISAPGYNIRSSFPYSDPNNKNNYEVLTGTSMAAPHVAGLGALLVSAYPNLSGNVTAIEDLIQRTALPLTTTQGCGGDDSDDVPNNVFGWGRIDAYAAYHAGIGTGALQVTLDPKEVLGIGAKWSVDGSPWYESNRTVTSLSAGEHLVSFKEIPGWRTPSQRTVMIKSGETTYLLVVYKVPTSGFPIPVYLMLEK